MAVDWSKFKPVQQQPVDWSGFKPVEEQATTSSNLAGLGARALDVGAAVVGGVANVSEIAGDTLTSALPQWARGNNALTDEVIAQQNQLQPLFDLRDYLRGESKAIGYTPDTSFDAVKEAFNPSANAERAAAAQAFTGQPDTPFKEISPLDRVATVGDFILDQTVTSLPDMAAALVALPAYALGRTQEIGERRVVNDGRTGEPQAGDLLAAAPGAIIESTLERFATGKLLPGGVPGASAPARIGAQVGIQAGTEGLEEAAANLAESVGTARGVDTGELADATMAGALVGGGMGAATQAATEGTRAIVDWAKFRPVSPPQQAAAADQPEPPQAAPAAAAPAVPPAAAANSPTAASPAPAGAAPTAPEQPAAPQPAPVAQAEQPAPPAVAPATPAVPPAPAVQAAPASPLPADGKEVIQSDAPTVPADPGRVPVTTPPAVDTPPAAGGQPAPAFKRTVFRGAGRADKGAVYGGAAVPILGNARYFANDAGVAGKFGPNIEQSDVELKNPLVIDDGEVWRQLTREAGWKFPNPTGLPEAELQQMTAKLQEVIRARGHDGVVVEFDTKTNADIVGGKDIKLLRNVFGDPQVVAFDQATPDAAASPDLSAMPQDADAVRRIKPKKARTTVPVTSTADSVKVDDDVRIYREAGYQPEQVANMPPRQKLSVAVGQLKKKYGFDVKVDPDINTIEATQQVVAAYRNIESMAAVLNMTPEAIGRIVPTLRLGKNIGALGYYSANENVLAIARMNDAFGHEFGHAIDWSVWKATGLIGANGEPDGRATTGKLRQGGSLSNKPLETAFAQLNEAMYKVNGDAAIKIASLEKRIEVIHNDIAKLQARLDVAFEPAAKAKIQQQIELKRKHIERIANQISGISNKPKSAYTADSNYYLNARMMDPKGATELSDKAYWQRPTEMFARAFEAWLAERIEAAGGDPRFVAQSNARYQSSIEFMQKAYPSQLERDAIFAAIEHMVNTLAAENVLKSTNGSTAEVRAAEPDPMVIANEITKGMEGRAKITEMIRDSLRDAKAQRERAAQRVRLQQQDAKEFRDSRNPSGSMVKDFILRVNDLQNELRYKGGFAMPISSMLVAMESRYPNSRGIKWFSKTFATKPGSGEARAQTYPEMLQQLRSQLSNRHAKVVERHKLMQWKEYELRQLYDTLTDDRPMNQRPRVDAKIIAAAADYRRLHDDVWMELQNAGIELGYARNGYLRRLVDEELVARDQAGFLNAAANVYLEVFERDVGRGSSIKLDEFIKYAGELLGRKDDGFKEIRRLIAAIKRAEAEGGDVEGARQELIDFLDGPVYDRVAEEFAKAAAADWMGRILGTTPSDDYGLSGAEGSFTKSRVLPESVERLMGDYMVTDPMVLTSSYLQSVSHMLTDKEFLSEGDRKLGVLSDMEALLSQEGVQQEDKEEIMASIQVLTGQMRMNVTTSERRWRSRLISLYTPVILSRSLMSQLAEPFTLGVRSGNLGDGFAVVRDQLQDLAQIIPGLNKLVPQEAKARSEWRREMAEFSGISTHYLFDEIINSRENMLYGGMESQQKMAKFYRWAGIHPHAVSMRRAAMERVFVHVRNMAKDALGGDQNAMKDLMEIGIPADADMLEWVAKLEDRISPKDLAEKPRYKEFLAAVNRFVNEAIQNPTQADKPRKASTFHGSLAYGLLSFVSAFTRNIIQGSYRRVVRAWSQGGTTGVKMTAAVGAAIGLQLAAMTAVYLARVAAFSDLDDELEKWEEDPLFAAFTIMSRSGWTGLADPIINAAMGVKYQRDLSALAVGPYLGYPLLAIQTIFNYFFRNSPNTNTAEVNATTAAYDLVISPLVAGIILRYAPPLTPAMMQVTARDTKEAVAELYWGEKGSKTGEALKRQRAREQGRDSGRGAGRDTGRN